MPSIGWLSSVSPRSSAPLVAAFRDGLKEKGFIEGKNLWIHYRWAEGHYDELETLATELVQRKVLVIAAAGGVVSARAAKKVTTQIPILFVSGFDPTKLGLVDSLSHPAGNATGVTVYSTELAKKRLQLLHELVPTAHTVAILANPGAIVTKIEVDDLGAAAQFFNLKLLLLNAGTDSEIDQAFATAAQQQAGAMIVSADPFFTSWRTQIVALAHRYSLPGCYPWREYAEAGGLLSYGAELTWAFQQIGIYAGMILKGAKSHDLPVQMPTTFKLVINLKTAKALSLAVPTAWLATGELIE